MVWLLRHRQVPFLLALFTVLALLYGSLLPPFEGPDEIEHTAYVIHLRQEARLPDFERDFNTPMLQAVGQLPLYYLTAALLTLPHPADSLDAGVVARNPWMPGPTGSPVTDNRNVMMMNPAFHVLSPEQDALVRFQTQTRLVSVLFGWLMVIGMYWGGLALFNGRRRWAVLAALLMMTIPQVLQVFAITTNDAAAIAFSTLVLAAALHLYHRWHDRHLLLLTGVLMGLGALSKVSVLAVFPVPVLAILVSWWRDSPRDLHALLRPALLVGIPVLVLAGWWYVRGWILFNDPLGTGPHQLMPWGYTEPQPVVEVLPRLTGVLNTLWFTGGWGSVQMNEGYNFLLAAGVLIGLVGLLRSWRDGRLWLMALTVLLGLIAIVRWLQLSDLIGGRLFLPYLSALVFILVWGIRSLHRARMWRMLMAGGAGALVVTVVPVTLLTAYWPRIYTEPPVTLQGPVLDFGMVRMVGYHITDGSIEYGDVETLTLCWQAHDNQQDPVPLPYPFAVQIVAAADLNFVDATDTVIGTRNSYLGLGKLTRLPPHQVVCDRFVVPINGETEIGRLYPIYVTLFNPETTQALYATQDDGLWSSKIVGHVVGR